MLLKLRMRNGLIARDAFDHDVAGFEVRSSRWSSVQPVGKGEQKCCEVKDLHDGGCRVDAAWRVIKWLSRES